MILSENFKLLPLPLVNSSLSPSLEFQAYASQNIFQAKTLVLLLHDEPTVQANLDGFTNQVIPGHSLLLDSSKYLVKWALDSSFAVIDMSIPTVLTKLLPDTFLPPFSQIQDVVYNNTQPSICEQVLDVWDNYVELSDSTNVILIGIGNACSGIVQLLKQREIRHKAKLCFSFISNHSIRPLRVPDETLINWYYKNSLVIVANSHPIFAAIEAGKNTRVYGRIERSRNENIEDVVFSSLERLTQFVKLKMKYPG